MGKNTLSTAVKGLGEAFKRRSPEILTGIGIAGMITMAVMAVKATPKALALLQKKKEETETDKLTPMETIKTAGHCYIPAIVTGVLSTACLIGASSAGARRCAALSTAYTLSESAFREYKGKVLEVIGEKKEQSVRDAVAKDRLDSHPVSSQEVIITEKGDTLCYDMLSGRYFKSDMDRLQKAANELNRQMLTQTYVSLNDFYYEIGLSNTSIGEDMGWNVNDGLVNLQFCSHLAEDGRPCLVVSYDIAPRYDFQYR